MAAAMRSGRVIQCTQISYRLRREKSTQARSESETERVQLLHIVQKRLERFHFPPNDDRYSMLHCCHRTAGTGENRQSMEGAIFHETKDCRVYADAALLHGRDADLCRCIPDIHCGRRIVFDENGSDRKSSGKCSIPDCRYRSEI